MADWSPSELSPIFWVDASTLSLNNNDAVSAWDDLSADGFDLAAGNSATFKTNILNTNMPVVQFDGSADYLVNNSFDNLNGASAWSFFIVAKSDNTNSNDFPFGSNGQGIGNQFYNNTYRVYAGNVAGYSTYTDTTYNILGSSFDGSQADNASRLRTRKNGGDNITLTYTGTIPASIGSANGITVGRPHATAAAYFQGAIAEIVLFSTALSTDDRQKVEGYLAHKWGLEANLPAGHPYKDAAPTSGPLLEIDAATNVDVYSATLNGELTDMGGEASLDVSFQYGETTAYGSETTPETLTAIDTVSANVSGLDSGTTYHFRLKATNGVDIWYSADNTFTTDSSPTPVIETDAATSIMAYAVTLNGELTDMGGIASLDVYFEYGLTAAYGSETTPETLTAIGTFNAEITEIESHTTYHFRAVVTDGTYTWYGADATFFSLYSFAPPAPVNLQGDPGPFTILWSWEEPFFIWPQITVTVGVDGVPYEYPKGIGVRYAPTIEAPESSVLSETPVSEDAVELSTPAVPSVGVSTTVFQKIEGVTISLADPCVITFEDHGLSDEAIVKFTTTGALPEEIVAGDLYFVDLINEDTFYLEYNIDGEKLVTTEGTQSGTHTLWYKL